VRGKARKETRKSPLFTLSADTGGLSSCRGNVRPKLARVTGDTCGIKQRGAGELESASSAVRDPGIANEDDPNALGRQGERERRNVDFLNGHSITTSRGVGEIRGRIVSLSKGRASNNYTPLISAGKGSTGTLGQPVPGGDVGTRISGDEREGGGMSNKDRALSKQLG